MNFVLPNLLGPLRQIFAEYTETPPGAFPPRVAPLKRILLIGAIPMGNNNISGTDVSWMREAFREVRKLGIPIDPEFDTEVMNIHPRCGGRDFLQTDAEADLIISCHVFNPDAHAHDQYARTGDHFTRISTLHGQEGAWHRRALQTGAKAIVVFGAGREINHTHFAGSGYSPVCYFPYTTMGTVLVNEDCQQNLGLRPLDVQVRPADVMALY